VWNKFVALGLKKKSRGSSERKIFSNMSVKVGTKRAFEHIQTPSPCSPHRIISLDSTEQVNKKRRVDWSGPIPSEQQETQARPTYETDFQSTSLAYGIDDSKIYEWLPKHKRSKFPPPTSQEKFLSLLDVKYIIAGALEETKQKLRSEYDQILAEKLQEQFNAFTRFNQDNIDRQMQSSTFDYMS